MDMIYSPNHERGLLRRDYVHYQWVREHVQIEIQAERKRVCEVLGEECGHIERRLCEMIESQRKTIEAQAKTIEALNERIKSVEAMFGQPGEANNTDRRKVIQ